MRKLRLLKYLAILWAGSWLVACAPVKPYVLTDLQRDPEFILIEMLATGLALGGVTVTAFPTTVEERDAFTAQLDDVLKQFSFYRILTPQPLSQKVPTERYRQILNYFEKHQTLPVEEIEKLRSVYTNARYILFVNIDRNTVSQRRVNNPDSIEFQSVRTIGVTMNIISLVTEKPALFTRITFNDVNSNSVQKLRGGGAILFGSVMAQVTFGGFPEPPPLEHTLYKVFLAVADQVPSN